MSKKVLWAAMACAVGLCIPSFVYGQARGSFSGTVTDKTGSVIAGVTVKAISEGTGASREAKTDDAGHYLIPLLPVANYTRAGFQSVASYGVLPSRSQRHGSGR